MALFGKKDDKEKDPEDVKAEETAVTEEKKEKKAVKSKEDTGDAYKVLVRPVVTEKTFKQGQLNKFAFAVYKNANKISVKKAVEKVYDVHVKDVNIVYMRGKVRNYGKGSSRTSNWKKAIVTLKPGEIIPGAEG